MYEEYNQEFDDYTEEFFNHIDVNGNDVPISENGLWEYPNQEVIVPTNGSITMKGVDYPVLGRSMETGEQQMMYPGNEYFFEDTQNVYETPQYQGSGQILNNEKVKEFYNDMLSSPWYEERLKNNGYENPEETSKKRLENINKTSLRLTDTKPTQFVRNLIFNKQVGNPYINFNSNQSNKEGSDYNSALTHEYGHGETTTNPLSSFETNQIQRRFKVDNIGQMSNQGLYLSSPEETKSDINAIRYKLFEQGKFNPKTGEYKTPSNFFEPSLLEDNQDDFFIKRMKEAYGNEGTIDLMNIIANNNDKSKEGNWRSLLMNSTAQNNNRKKVEFAQLGTRIESRKAEGGEDFIKLPDGREIPSTSDEYRKMYDSGILYGVDPEMNYFIQENAHPELKRYSEISRENPYSEFIQSYLNDGVTGLVSKATGQTVANSPQSYKDRYNEMLNKKWAEDVFARNPKNEGESRGSYLNRISDSINNEDFVDSLYQNLPTSQQETLWQRSKRGLEGLAISNTSIGDTMDENVYESIQNNDSLSQYEKNQLLKEYKDSPYLSMVNTNLQSMSALDVPAKMVQSIYRNEYSFDDALQGKQNNASMLEDIVTNPLTYKVDKVVKALPKVGNIMLTKGNPSNVSYKLAMRNNPLLEIAQQDATQSSIISKNSSNGVQSLSNLFNTIKQRSPKLAVKLFPGQTGRSKRALEVGNKWNKEWYNNPITQERLQELSKNSSTFDAMEWKDAIRNIEDETYKVHFQSNLNKWKRFLNSEKHLHNDNYGVSYSNIGKGQSIDAWRPVNPNGTQNFVDRYIEPYKIKSTVIHEGNHGVFPSLYDNRRMFDVKEDLDFYSPSIREKLITPEAQRQLGYLHKPEEVYARIQEIRAENNLAPGEIVTDDMIMDIFRKGNKGNSNVEKDFYFTTNPFKLKDLMNKVPGIGVGVGGAVMYNESSK